MKLFGLTGGIACGKSTVVRLLERDHGVHVIDCDELVKDLQRPRSACVRAIAAAFAEDKVVDPRTGELDRVKLGSIVFRDESKRRVLAGIMKVPTVRAVLGAIWHAWRTLPADAIVVVDAPLLFETKYLVHLCSAVIVVASSEQRQIVRMKHRNQLERDDALARIRSQMPVEEKARRADYVLRNDFESQPPLRAEVERLAEFLRSRDTRFTGWNRAVAVGSASVVGLFAVGLTATRLFGRSA